VAEGYYARLVEQYPMTHFADVARRKLDRGLGTPLAAAGPSGGEQPEAAAAERDTLAALPPKPDDAFNEVASRAVDFWMAEKPPEPLHQVEPEYPEAARRSRLEGKVIVRFLVDEEGAVGRPEVLKGDPTFEQATLNAIRQFRFKPATQNEFPVAVWMQMPIIYSLAEGDEWRPRQEPMDAEFMEIPPKLVEKGDLDEVLTGPQPEIGGRVVVRLLVAEDGKVKDVKVVTGPAMLHGPAEALAYTYRYIPGIQEAVVQASWVETELQF
jgi:protein TonB